MKRTACITAILLALSPLSLAAVGNTVNTSFYVADGVILNTQADGTLVPNRVESTRFYDSTKGAEWVSSSKTDLNLCWVYAASNSIQYWQSYYGVFATPQKGSYYTDDGTLTYNAASMPLPYGNIGTESTKIIGPNGTYEDTIYSIPNPKQLEVARDMYYSIAFDAGGTFKGAAEWFFRSQSDLLTNDGKYFMNAPYGSSGYVNCGGYYRNYFGDPPSADAYKDITRLLLSYTTVYSTEKEAIGTNHNSTTGTPFANNDIQKVTELIKQGFGINADGIQTESGLIPAIGITDADNTGHMVTCYGFSTDENGLLSSVLLADSNDGINNASNIIQRYVKIYDNGTNQYIGLYTDKNCTQQWGTYYINEISYINTPQVLQDMLAEYSDVSDEAQVWNGHSTVWEQQTATTEALPTESTGWDVHVNGSNIDTEHHGYYHTYATDNRAVLFDAHAETANRQITINGTVSASHIEVAAAGYEFKAGAEAELAAGADMLIRQAATLHSELALNLANLTLEAGATLSSPQTIKVEGDFIISLKNATTLSLENAATTSIDANLDVSAADSILLQTTLTLNENTLQLAKGQTITLSFTDTSAPIIANIGTLLIGDTTIANGTNLSEHLNFISPQQTELTNLSFIYQNNSILAVSIPEPTTATLSLIALVALTIRRRRATVKASA